jgi:AAA domain
MTHPLFRKEIFVETAFERRFQAMLRSAWHKRSWHVIVADPGSGKTMGIRDLVKTAGSRAILAIVTPKNNEDEQALGDQLYTALGLPLRGHWRTRKPKLMGHLHQCGTECLVVDDAHDLSLEHLMFLKEITDQGRLQYDHPLGLCLVAAGRGNTIPLKETLDLPDPTWLQFRRRLDKMNPFCRIAGHTSEEVREILAALETVYRELFPQLNLRRWTGSIYTWLTQPVLDPTSSGRVTMDYLMKLVTTALEWTYQAGEIDVQAETLEAAASLLVLRRDTLWLIDGAGPDGHSPQPRQSNGADGASETEAEQVSSPTPSPQPPRFPPEDLGNQAKSVSQNLVPANVAEPPQSAKCTFSGIVQIPLKRFEESGVALVECPGCGRAWTLAPRGGGLRFKSHDRRKTTTPVTSKRWARMDSDWNGVGGGSTRREP